MFEPKNYFDKGPSKTVLLKPGVHFSVQGPWTTVNGTTELDRWHLGDFAAVEYTFVADYDFNAKEIIKCLVTAAAPQEISLTIYGRSNVGNSLIDIQATVNSSYVTILAIPKTIAEGTLNGSNVYFDATYFKNNHPLRQRQPDSLVETVGVGEQINTFDSNTVTMDSNTFTFDRG